MRKVLVVLVAVVMLVAVSGCYDNRGAKAASEGIGIFYLR
jgi:uncharacterized lipoprotein YehR (DUF1307 family)